jgi:hypothetical protein
MKELRTRLFRVAANLDKFFKKAPERDDLASHRHPGVGYCRSMMLSENCGIMP